MTKRQVVSFFLSNNTRLVFRSVGWHSSMQLLYSALFNVWLLGVLWISPFPPTRRAKDNEGAWVGGHIGLVCMWRHHIHFHSIVEPCGECDLTARELGKCDPKEREHIWGGSWWVVSVQSILHETFWLLICLSPLSYFLVQNFCKAGYYLRIPEKTPTKIILAMNQYYLYEHSFSEIFVGVEEEVWQVWEK